MDVSHSGSKAHSSYVEDHCPLTDFFQSASTWVIDLDGRGLVDLGSLIGGSISSSGRAWALTRPSKDVTLDLRVEMVLWAAAWCS